MVDTAFPSTQQPTRLGDLKRVGDQVLFNQPVLQGFNLGSRTINITLSMEKFREMSDVANEARFIDFRGDRNSLVAQRSLDEKHARAIALYILRGLLSSLRVRWEEENRDVPEELYDILTELGEGPYQGLQPITGNIRECEPGGADLGIDMQNGQLILTLRQGQIIWVIDGQHRRYGYQLLIEWLRDITQRARYTKRGAVYLPAEREDMEFRPSEMSIWSGAFEEARSCTVDVTVHLGLDVDQERQLFHDLNNLGKKPDAAIAQAFDQANPVSLFIRNEIEPNSLLGSEIKIADSGSKKGSKRTEPEADQTIYRDDLMVANSLLFAGAWNQAGITASKVTPYYEYGSRFWSALAGQPNFGASGWSKLTLLAQPVMIKALAQLAFTFKGSREADEDNLERYLSAIEAGEIDFSPTAQLWRAYLMPPEERAEQFPGIERYLTPSIAMQAYAVDDQGQLRFGPASRDIARYLGDLIRWRLSLPPRPALVSLVKRLIGDGRLPPETINTYDPVALALSDLDL